MVRPSKALTPFARLLIVVTGHIPLVAHADCQRPSTISVPDGTMSTLEDMLAAQSDLKVYMASMEGYLACVNEELRAGGDDAPAEYKSELATTHSSAVIELEALAAAFSRELQSFFRAHPELKNIPQTRTRSASQIEPSSRAP